MHGHDCGHEGRRESWRAAREAKRAAWRARRAARRARWAEHWGDMKAWGLDPEGLGLGGGSASSEVEALKAKVAEMEKTIASLSQRVIVLEKLAVDDEPRLAAEIEKLRRSDEGTK